MGTTQYTEEIGAEICELVANGFSVRAIVKRENMPAMSTIFKWLSENKAFSEQYTRAREVQADYFAEEIIEIADYGLNDTYVDDNGNTRVDHDHIRRSELRVNARKWAASKLNPKKYGDHSKLELMGKDGGPIETYESSIAGRAERVNALFESARTRRSESVDSSSPQPA